MGPTHLNRGRYKNIKGVLLVEGFPVRLHVAEVRSRVVGAHLKYLQAGVHLVGETFSKSVVTCCSRCIQITSVIEIMVIGCCLTSDILWSFLMTVLPAEIIRPSFFHINVLRKTSIIAVDDVDEDDDDMGYDDDDDDNGWS